MMASVPVPLPKLLSEGGRVAFAALRANWVRTALTVLGIGIGVGVVVTMAAMITGIRSQVMESFESSDPDNFLLSPWDFSQVRLGGDGSGRAPWWDRPPISNQELRRLQALPTIKEAIATYDFGAAIRHESEWVRNIEWRGTSSGWAAYTPGDFVAGRDFTPTEVNQARGVMVISGHLAETLFGTQDPIGKRVRVSAGRRASNELFTVVGVFEPVENVFGELAEDFAVMPFTAADKRLKARTRFTFLVVQVVPHETATSLQAQ
ncbi:MAG: ABC transporter permease, partial [Longimicrobiales bacterium]